MKTENPPPTPSRKVTRSTIRSAKLDKEARLLNNANAAAQAELLKEGVIDRPIQPGRDFVTVEVKQV